MNLLSITLFAMNLSMMQNAHPCENWFDPGKRIYDICAGIGFTPYFCGIPRGNVISYHIFVDGNPKDVDVSKQKLVQLELMYTWPSSNGLVAYVASHPVTVPVGRHTVQVTYSDLNVSFPIIGVTSITSLHDGTVSQCPSVGVRK